MPLNPASLGQILAIAASLMTLVAMFAYFGHRMRFDGQWHDHELPPWQKVTFIDGQSSKRGDVVMRRRIAGGWQYRRQTSEEEFDKFVNDAI